MLDAEGAGALEEPVHRRTIEVAGAAQTISLGKARKEFEIHLLRQATEGAVTDVLRLAQHARFQVVRRQADDLAVWRREMKAVQDIGAFRNVGRNLLIPGRSVESIRIAEARKLL